MKKKRVVIIVGPTAVGKTEFSIAIASSLKGEIVSADSMQIYKGMDIGSAKPTKDEQTQCKHYLIDEIDPSMPFSVAEYAVLAKKYIGEITEKGMLPIVSGGTGLYVNSLIYKMDFFDAPATKPIREQYEKEAAEFGNEYVHNKLKEIDPMAAERIHPNNLKRVIRAIEIYSTSGEFTREFDESFVMNDDYEYILIGLTREREELYSRIDLRVDLLIAKGLVEEVIKLKESGLTTDDISMKGIGYKEILDYIAGDYDYDTAIKLIKRNSRRYAKRQLTWFKRYPNITWFNLSEYRTQEGALNEILDVIVSK